MRRLTAIAGLALAFASCSSTPSVTARLRSPEGEVVGVAVLSAARDGTRITVDVAGLEHDTEYRGGINAGVCDRPGASFLPIPHFTTDEDGRARISGELLFRGREPIELSTLADGEHVVRVIGHDGNAACSVIPRVERS